MPKIDMPIGVGNKDYSDEAKKLTELMFDAGRTSTGQVEYPIELQIILTILPYTTKEMLG